jgi:hypothetical protein
LAETGGSIFVVVAGLFLLIAGVVVTRWVRQSAGRMSVVVAPLVLLGGLALEPQVTDPCAPTTTVAATTTIALSTTTTTIALTCVEGGPCVVGDTGPGGGIVFYVADSTQSWGRYLEAACAGWQNNCDGTTIEACAELQNNCHGTTVDPLAGWGCYGTEIAGADGTAIGTGEQNTADIVAGCGIAGIAARLADNYGYNGLDDWFLPSKDELNALCKWAYSDTANAVCNDDGSGSLSLTYGGVSDYAYWSSSESADVNAWDQNFASGEQYHHDKGYPYYVRPVRAF